MAATVLNHIALMVEDPERMKDFYCRWFGFEELNRTDDGSVYVTDGHFNMGLLKKGAASWESDQWLGPHHVGLTVESVRDVERRLQEFYPDIRLERRPAQDPYSEYRLQDPEKNVIIHLSEKGYGVDPTATGRVPGIKHIATINHDMPAQFAFWQKVFELPNANRTEAELEEHIVLTLGEDHRKWRSTDDAPFCGDGFMNLAILPFRAGRATGSEGKGFDHFGMLCPEPRDKAEAVLSAVPGTRLLNRPPDRQTEYRFVDPEGNHFDLSSKKGWKVSPDKWANLSTMAEAARA